MILLIFCLELSCPFGEPWVFLPDVGAREKWFSGVDGGFLVPW